MSKEILDTKEFSELIVKFTENTKRDVITDVDEVGDNFGMSVEVDEEFIEMFEKDFSKSDFQLTLNKFFEEAIKTVLEEADKLQ